MRRWVVALVVAVVWSAGPASAQVAKQIGVGDTALLFGGIDAEGGIGDWYVSNGVVEAVIDDVGPQPDLVGLLGASAPPKQSEAAFTGGSIIDLGRVGLNNDQLPQMFTVGGLSTSNFILYTSITAPNPNTVRATGGLLFPPFSVAPTPCLAIQSDFQALGADPFLTVTTTATNNCGVTVTGFGGFLDVAIWTQRGIAPFSGLGTGTFGGRGFEHPALDLGNPITSLEIPMFAAGPGVVGPGDGVVDPANGTVSGEVSYGILGVEVQLDQDGPGGAAPVVTPVNTLFGVSSTFITALGNPPLPGPLNPGGTLTYVRRLYVGGRNDVRSSADAMLTALSSRVPFNTGTISGDVDAADTADVAASIVIRRVGRCSLNPSIPCRNTAVCSGAGAGTCQDPVPTPNAAPGHATSHVRTEPDGTFSGVVLPHGDYELTVSAFERDDVVVAPVVVGAGNTAVAIPPLTPLGEVVFTVREKRGGSPPLPAKLTFKGVAPTPDPRFNHDLDVTLGGNDVQPETVGGTQPSGSVSTAAQANVVYTPTGSGAIQIRPGTYDVYVSRGNEYTVAKRTITVAAGGVASVDARLKRVIRTKNAMSADFHIHSGRSLDSSAPLRHRVSSFAAEGVEVMVSTDHDKLVDYAPIIVDLGIGSRITSIPGNEVTGSVPNPPHFPNSYGHINAWPLAIQKDEPRDGAIQDEFLAPNFIYTRLRNAGADVIQINHPRAGVSGLTTIGLFNNIGCNRCANDIDTTCTVDADCPAAPAPQDCTCVGYQPDRPLTMPPNDILLDDGIVGPGSPPNPDGFTNLDFDVFEMANGARATDFPGLRRVRRDWLSLLNQGVFKPQTGVSDSHRLTIEHAGWARTYVNGVGDEPAALDVSNFDAQVNAGNMLVSAGPYITFTARAPATGQTRGIGQMVSSPDGRVGLKIRVTSPAWIPVEEVRIIANGFVVASFDSTTKPGVKAVPANFQASGGTRRFSRTIVFNVTQDTYFLVEAGAKLPANINTLPTPPPIMDIVVPGVVPWAATNPIFVDVNGNGVFDPPGLPVMTAAADTERPAFAQVRMESAPPGLWARLRHGLARIASRFSGGTVTAQERPPGEMTGVTEEEKAEAAREGEYFPLYEGFRLPADVMQQVEEAERARAAREGQAAPSE